MTLMMMKRWNGKDDESSSVSEPDMDIVGTEENNEPDDGDDILKQITANRCKDLKSSTKKSKFDHKSGSKTLKEKAKKGDVSASQTKKSTEAAKKKKGKRKEGLVIARSDNVEGQGVVKVNVPNEYAYDSSDEEVSYKLRSSSKALSKSKRSKLVLLLQVSEYLYLVFCHPGSAQHSGQHSHGMVQGV